MNKQIIKFALQSGMLNYVDHETPRHYFLCNNVDEECLEKFAKLIVMECAYIAEIAEPYQSSDLILKHFEVK